VLTDFWKGVGGNLAEKWAAASIPALIFWLGGALAWLSSAGGLSTLTASSSWFDKQPASTQLGVLILALLGVMASAVVVQQLTTPALRLLEGYWPAIADPVRWRLAARVERRASRLDEEFQRVAETVADGSATVQQRATYVRLDAQLRRLPANGSYQPTTIGNTLRAAESRPVDKYGLDAVAVWPRLWLVLPEGTQKELAATRRSLDTAVATCVWSMLFVVFTAWSWWPLLAGSVLAVLVWRFWVPSRAALFADMIEATFDVYRTALYQQLRWPLPADPCAEHAAGRLVTEYLVRGLDDDEPKFTTP
jgi:Flp pilus assembly protein TadB